MSVLMLILVLLGVVLAVGGVVRLVQGDPLTGAIALVAGVVLIVIGL